ncbi:hypothetical protein P7L75_01335 (plasmid) [Tistrella mobilis]|uniref:hypothetical protein n=1 Tax=Tistrella mobilis TaxID=171437 RepID=UPI003555FFFC
MTLAEAPVPAGQLGMWRVIREMCQDEGEVSALALRRRCRTDGATARGYLIRLTKAGILEPVRVDEKTRAKMYRMVADPGEEAPSLDLSGAYCARGLRQDYLWRTIKMQGGEFTAADLVAVIKLDPAVVAPVGEAQARIYCYHLARAGILIRIDADRYRFDRAQNLGPKAPMILAAKVVYDPNRGRVIGRPEAEPVDG